MEIVSWTPGDNGRDTREVKPEHAFFVEGLVDDIVNGYATPAAPSSMYATGPPAAAAQPEPVAAAPPSASFEKAAAMSFEDFLKQQGQGN